MQRRVVFPFTAIVGLDKFKLAVIINAINPKVGGLLIRGPKGSGKTTVVRALADVLPKTTVVKECIFKCNPHDPSNMCLKCAELYHKGENLPSEEKKMTVVNLPLGATEDRVVGSLDVEKAIKLGVEALEPGLLAEANQNILYVDEINLLPDHIADDLLDAAATGWNIVEREGISVGHPSRFVFVGTMNPEEGELRPQLLDRFSLSVGVEKISAVGDRIEIVKRNTEFEKDPVKFCEKYKSSQDELANRIVRAREILPKVEMPEQLLVAICRTTLDLKVDGMRPDIVIAKAATTLAAFENRKDVTLNDALIAAELALSHRTREGGFLEPATPEEIERTLVNNAKEEFIEEDKSLTPPPEGERDEFKDEYDPEGLDRKRPSFSPRKGADIDKDSFGGKVVKPRSVLSRALGRLMFGSKEKIKPPKETAPKTGIPLDKKTTEKQAFEGSDVTDGAPMLTKIERSTLPPSKLSFKMKRRVRSVTSSLAGKRAETVTTLHRGRASGWRFPKGKPRDVHLPATIRTAARRQKYREKPLGTALKICMEDVREKSRLYRAPMTIVFVIDLSGSMAFSVAEAKEAILKLHGDAYRGRDKVGIVAMKGAGAVVVQHPIANLRVVANKLSRLGISGYTPLAAGMLSAIEVLKEAKRRDMSTVPVMAIITDGGANVPLQRSLETGEIRTFSEVDIDARKYDDVAVRDVFAVSKVIKREGIYTVVVNTNPYIRGRETYGYAVTKQIASLTNGTYHEVGKLYGEKLVRKMFEGISEDKRIIAHDASTTLSRYR
jgi:magnesium chelatase subunit D